MKHVGTSSNAKDIATQEQLGGGGSGAGGNVFIQQTDPLATSPYIWYQTDEAGNVIDILKG